MRVLITGKYSLSIISNLKKIGGGIVDFLPTVFLSVQFWGENYVHLINVREKWQVYFNQGKKGK